MKKISEEQQKELEFLYNKYYDYLCKYELGHPFEPYDKSKPSHNNMFQWYHMNDFRANIEEEAYCIKVNMGY